MFLKKWTSVVEMDVGRSSMKGNPTTLEIWTQVTSSTHDYPSNETKEKPI